jgi:hypothetical protein
MSILLIGYTCGNPPPNPMEVHFYSVVPYIVLLTVIGVVLILRMGVWLSSLTSRPRGMFASFYARRIRSGHCPNCDYDLRATPDRCPECGHSVPQPPSNVLK